MAVRTSMAELIGRVRDLISEPTTTNISDQAVQDALDHHRIELTEEPLMPRPHHRPGGVPVYDTYLSPLTDWESDAIFLTINYAVVTLGDSQSNDVAEWLAGKWYFDPAVHHETGALGVGIFPPLRITGKSYDIYLAAADCMDELVRQIKHNVSIGQGGDRIDANASIASIRDLANDYKRQGRIVVSQLYRTDEVGYNSGGWPW